MVRAENRLRPTPHGARMTRPKKRKREPMGLREPAWWRSNRHRAHVRRFECILAHVIGHTCVGKPVCAHDREETDGCGSEKPSDFNCFPACDDLHGNGAHPEQHRLGERAFQRKYGVSIKSWVAAINKSSPCRREIEEWQKSHSQRGYPSSVSSTAPSQDSTTLATTREPADAGGPSRPLTNHSHPRVERHEKESLASPLTPRLLQQALDAPSGEEC